MYYCDIDITKHRHELAVLDEAGVCVLNMHFANSQQGLEKLLEALASLKIEPENISFCLEATGHYWLALYCQLKELGYQLHVINPIQSDALRNLYVRKAKTDKKDALLLADLVRLGRPPATQLASETTLKLQTLSRLRLEFVHQVGGLKNRVLGILDRIFPEYPECFSDVFIRTSRELLKSYPEPELLAEADLSELTAFLNQYSRGRLHKDRAEQIQALAKGTFGIVWPLMFLLWS